MPSPAAIRKQDHRPARVPGQGRRRTPYGTPRSTISGTPWCRPKSSATSSRPCAARLAFHGVGPSGSTETQRKPPGHVTLCRQGTSGIGLAGGPRSTPYRRLRAAARHILSVSSCRQNICSGVVSPRPPWLSRHDRASAAISSGMNALCTPIAVVAPDLYSEFRDNFPLLPGNVW